MIRKIANNDFLISIFFPEFAEISFAYSLPIGPDTSVGSVSSLVVCCLVVVDECEREAGFEADLSELEVFREFDCFCFAIRGLTLNIFRSPLRFKC